MHTTLTASCLHDITFFSLKKPRSDPYNLGTSPKVCLWRSSEATTCCSSMGFPSQNHWDESNRAKAKNLHRSGFHVRSNTRPPEISHHPPRPLRRLGQ